MGCGDTLLFEIIKSLRKESKRRAIKTLKSDAPLILFESSGSWMFMRRKVTTGERKNILFETLKVFYIGFTLAKLKAPGVKVERV